MEKDIEINILFSDFFDISPEIIEKYGAFNISLISDLPLFIDPFALFNSKKDEYQALHQEIIKYLKFLRDKSTGQNLDKGIINALFSFKEVKQTWFGFSVMGNKGSALGEDFANALNENFNEIFSKYGEEQITEGTHLEKLCLVKEGVGKDNISDFATNLIKLFLLEYTQKFAKEYLKPEQCKNFTVTKVRFNYETESWTTEQFYLPNFKNDFVLLTPKDLLTKDETWINREDLIEQFQNIPPSIDNLQLRSLINNYFRSVLPADPKKKDEKEAAMKTIRQYPEVIDYYIRYKEQNGDRATDESKMKVEYSEKVFLQQFPQLNQILATTPFYKLSPVTYKESLERAKYLKDCIENKDGYRIFYVDGNPIQKEEYIKILFRFTWFGSPIEYDTEVNNGRGFADGKASLGSADVTIVEFKLASNTQLEKNLKNQVGIYETANDTKQSIKVIIYYSQKEYDRVREILNRLGLQGRENVILVDARNDNKPSASKA